MLGQLYDVEHVCKNVLLRIDSHLDATGWDLPAVLFELSMDEDHNGDLGISVYPHSVFTGDLVASLFSATPKASPGSVGVVLCSEGWVYGPVQQDRIDRGEQPDFPPALDPDRREVRLLQLVLKDGTELALHRERGEQPSFLDDSSFDGWLAWALRRVVSQPSGAPQPSPDLPLRLALTWQVSHLLSFSPPPDADAASWGSFTIPGLSPRASLAAREPWCDPAQAGLVAPLDVRAFARALRSQASTPFPLSFPLCRDDEYVQIESALVDWCDDEMLAILVDAAVPPKRQVLETALSLLPRPHQRSLRAWAKSGSN